MPDIDPELRDKIIETHTLVKRIDEDHKEHKAVMNARIRDAKKEFEGHKDDVKIMFEKHDVRIGKGETFRTRVIAYATVGATLGAVFIEFVVSGGKRMLGL